MDEYSLESVVPDMCDEILRLKNQVADLKESVWACGIQIRDVKKELEDVTKERNKYKNRLREAENEIDELLPGY